MAVRYEFGINSVSLFLHAKIVYLSMTILSLV